MDFCPTCGNLLLLESMELTGQVRQYCRTCPYVQQIEDERRFLILTKKKVVDDVLGGEDAWQNVDKTDVNCPKCSHSEAYYMQIQIRSADEPMTTFYKCCNISCNHRWREG